MIAFRGLRRSEALGLPWVDVDLDRKTVTIRETRVQVGADVVEGDSKTDTSARTVSLDAGTLEVLRAHRRRQAELRLLLGSAWIDTGLVFAKAEGSARSGQRVAAVRPTRDPRGPATGPAARPP